MQLTGHLDSARNTLRDGPRNMHELLYKRATGAWILLIGSWTNVSPRTEPMSTRRILLF
jgi:hypothetical protein